MRPFITLIVAGLLFSAVPAIGQVTVSVKDKPLTEALVEIEKQSGYSFFYSSTLEDANAIVSVSAQDEDIRTVMDRLLAGLSVSYEIKPDKQITLISVKKDSRTQDSWNGKITGTVKDATGLPVIGAGVMVKGESGGTVTDMDGHYEIEVSSPDAVLEFSCLGYTSTETGVGKRNVIDVVLREDVQFLDEVVVVGYGTQKKVNLTGSVSMVDSEEIAARPIASVASGLQGMLPGVTVVNPSGQPGVSNTTIRVRGVGTIGNANPLILVDGVEGDISSLNPEDIESVSVLKDAASSAIYGARAANGVLLVTTKKLAGEKGKTRVSLGAYFGLQTPTRLPEMCDAIEFMTLDNEARQNVGTPDAWLPEDFDKVRNNTDPNHFANTDFFFGSLLLSASSFMSMIKSLI